MQFIYSNEILYHPTVWSTWQDLFCSFPPGPPYKDKNQAANGISETTL